MAVSVRGIVNGHLRLFVSIAVGVASLFLLPRVWPDLARGLTAWDLGSAFYLLTMAWLAYFAAPASMAGRAEAQQDGEWTLFFIVLAGAAISFAAILGEFSSMKDAPAGIKQGKIALVAATLVVSWLLTQAVFALRYAHEYYARSNGAELDRGLQFPDETCPDYWDFLYFSIVLGMTFQVSDVQITARKLRRLATLHGLLGFLFNTVIIALTVNLASGLL